MLRQDVMQYWRVKALTSKDFELVREIFSGVAELRDEIPVTQM
jgi:hypothetical protein